MEKRNAMFLVNPQDVEREAVAQGVSRTELELPQLVFLTFNRCVLDELSNLCQLEEWEWPGGRFTPYSPPDKGWRGKLDEQRKGSSDSLSDGCHVPVFAPWTRC